jgi:hypothetical protein
MNYELLFKTNPIKPNLVSPKPWRRRIQKPHLLKTPRRAEAERISELENWLNGEESNLLTTCSTIYYIIMMFEENFDIIVELEGIAAQPGV